MILHCSPSGAIERVIYALLEKEAIKMNKGQKPMLPIWLSPVQVRFIPIGGEFVKTCKQFIDEIDNTSPFIRIRADIDDREESVGKKIREAEKEWIPIIIVVGDKEKDSKKFKPRFRTEELGTEKDYNLSEIQKLIVEKTKKYPQHMLPLSLHLSKRPKFK